MAKQRPHTIILTEIVQRSKGTEEREIGVPVASIRKLVTERSTLWEKGQNDQPTPREATSTLIECTNKDVIMVKESVRQITNLMNGVDIDR
jgi:hypothetical protein